MSSRFITSLWLTDAGFLQHYFAGQPNPHFLLWLSDDLGLELSFGRDKPDPWWFSWVRTRGSHTFQNSVHLRYLSFKHEVIVLVQALTGRRWNTAYHYNGQINKRIRREKGTRP